MVDFLLEYDNYRSEFKHKTELGKERKSMKKEEIIDAIKVKGGELLQKVKDIIAKGNASKIRIKGEDGKTVASFPINVGLIATIGAPVFVAVGAMAAVINDCTIEVVRKTDDSEKSKKKK